MGRPVDGDYYRLTLIDRNGKPVGVTIELPSATAVLKALYKGGLDWWGHKIGVTGVLDLLTRGELTPEELKKHGSLEAAAEAVYAQVKEAKRFRPDVSLAASGARGSDVHHIAEYICKNGAPPAKRHIPKEQHGYVQGLWDWWQDEQPHVLHSELSVFSLAHRFAGTLDLLEIPAATLPPLDMDNPDPEIVRALFEMGEPEVVDFKTNAKGEVYDSHLLQVTAYAAAVHEMGLTESMPRRKVVAVSEKGRVKVVEANDCSLDDFLAVKRAWEYLQVAKDQLSKASIKKPSASKQEVAS